MSVAMLLFALPHFVLEAYKAERPNINDAREHNSSVCSLVEHTKVVEDTNTTSLSTWAIYLTALTTIGVTGLLPLWTTGTLAERSVSYFRLCNNRNGDRSE